MTQDSFWTDFLRPLKDKEKPEKYDTGFKTRLQTEPELILEKNENENSMCLSRMILGQLQVQTKQTEKGKIRKVIACEQRLSDLIKPDESETQSRDSSQSQSVHREMTPSTSSVRYGDSVTAKNKANLKTTIQQGLYKYGFGKVKDGGDTTSAIHQENQEIQNPPELHKDNFNEVNDSCNNPPATNQTTSENMNGRESNKQNSKEVNDVIILTNGEINDDVNGAKESDTKRFKNAEVNSEMQSDIIADRRTEDPDNDKDTKDESSLDPTQKEQVKKIASIVNAKDKIEKQKSHQQICVSSWTLKGLNSYITRKQLSLEKTLNASEVKVEQFDGDRFSYLQTSLVHRSRQLLAYRQCFDDEDERGLRLWSLQFSDPILNEMTVSLMVFEVLCAVCQLCDVRLKPEEFLKKGEYPNARVDYALVYKDVVFGVVEIKTPQKMTAAAVAQLLLPLLKLQNESGQEEMQYVGILTDGFRYVLVRLQGDKFTFENGGTATKDPKLHIRRAVKWKDLSTLCGDIQSVFRSATDKLKELTKK